MSEKITGKKWVLAIDPGSHKIGYSIVYEDLSHGEMGIISLNDFPTLVNKYFANLEQSDQPILVVGNGTGSCKLCELYKTLVPESFPCIINERNTTLDARKKFFEENPPRGLRRLIPKGLLFPSRPIDDYAAWVIGRKYFKSDD